MPSGTCMKRWGAVPLMLCPSWRYFNAFLANGRFSRFVPRLALRIRPWYASIFAISMSLDTILCWTLNIDAWYLLRHSLSKNDVVSCSRKTLCSSVLMTVGGSWNWSLTSATRSTVDELRTQGINVSTPRACHDSSSMITLGAR